MATGASLRFRALPFGKSIGRGEVTYIHAEFRYY